MPPSELRSFRARYVFPIDAPVIPHGCVTLRDSQIIAVGSESDGAAATDLGNVAILPGLVNAHTHLEYSDLASPLGRAGNTFADWLRLVIQFRRENQRDVPRNARLGVQESLRAGVAAVGEIATTGWSAELFEATPLHVTAFGEVINLAEDFIETKLAAAAEHLACKPGPSGGWLAGISPHAPYTVHPKLFTRLVDLARRHAAPLMVHLAESPEELQLLANSSGPLRDLFEDLGVWNPAAIPPMSRPLDYLRQIATLPRSLVAHGNYLADEEIAFVGQHADRLAVIYCPRTHAYFAHEPYPLMPLLAAGALVAIGTDSRASSPDLNLMDDIRHVALHHPVSPAQAFELGTLAGAKALGTDRELGSLTAGKRSPLVVVELPDHSAADPYELLLDPAAMVRQVIW